MWNYLLVLMLSCLVFVSTAAAQGNHEVFVINSTSDFAISGNGSAGNWKKTEWLSLQPYKKRVGTSYTTRLKALYSSKGIYFLFECSDSIITSTMNADFMDLWKEDVVEVFLHTDTTLPSYFEYEVSPRNFELPLLIANVNGELRRWMPFYYEQNRKVVHKTSIEKKGDSVIGWTAEFFIPYTLLSPLKNNIPKKGMRWRANFYRVDYDGDEYASWLWKPIRQNFHDWERFGVIEFD
jgi:hypothetical protein